MQNKHSFPEVTLSTGYRVDFLDTEVNDTLIPHTIISFTVHNTHSQNSNKKFYIEICAL